MGGICHGSFISIIIIEIEHIAPGEQFCYSCQKNHVSNKTVRQALLDQCAENPIYCEVLRN